MKKVYCSYSKCGDRRSHFEKPDVPRRRQSFEVPNDTPGPWFCSIECMSYAWKNYKTIAKHIPNFVEADDGMFLVTTFNNTDELLDIDWVKQWKEGQESFQFSLYQGHLMAEWYEGNKHVWWVVGNLSSVEDIDLPKLEI